MQAHPHTSCHPLRHETLPATRSSSKLPASTHVVLTESRASDQEEESESQSSCSTASEDEIMVTVNNFPVNLIALECCTATLDSYISNNENIKDQEWDSIVLQILMMLITNQKVIKMTHNAVSYTNLKLPTTPYV